MTHCGALVVGHDVLSVFSLSHDSLEGGGVTDQIVKESTSQMFSCNCF